MERLKEAPQWIILFDGECYLCSNVVQWIIGKDKKEIFHFTSLQSNLGKQILSSFGMPTAVFNTFVLTNGDKCWVRSEAAMKVVQQLPFPWRILSVFKVVPIEIRDMVYDFVSRNRFKWFGKRTSCWMPNESLKRRILD